MIHCLSDSTVWNMLHDGNIEHLQIDEQTRILQLCVAIYACSYLNSCDEHVRLTLHNAEIVAFESWQYSHSNNEWRHGFATINHWISARFGVEILSAKYDEQKKAMRVYLGGTQATSGSIWIRYEDFELKTDLGRPVTLTEFATALDNPNPTVIYPTKK